MTTAVTAVDTGRPAGWTSGRPLVRFTAVACDLGVVALAATDKGICWLGFRDTDADAETALRAEFPKATLARADDALAGWATELQKHLAGEQPHLNLPLDVRATAFQREVWDALLAIPHGQTRTYKQVAEAIGRPTAVRAVARACATNPVAVLVPCHRVIGTDGALTGYAGGLPRKKKLLEVERGANRSRPPASE